MNKLLQRCTSRKAFVLVAVIAVCGLISFGSALALSSRASKKSAHTDCSGVTCIDLFANKAVPDAVTIPIGGSVQFNSKDNTSHSLSLFTFNEHENAPLPPGSFVSGEFKGNEAWKVRFTENGTYTFRDDKHPEISPVVIVYTPNGDYRIK